MFTAPSGPMTADLGGRVGEFKSARMCFEAITS